MSGIFGFTYREADTTALSDALGGLEYWNRIYGREASDTRTMDRSGIGCHIEHFSESFPYGGPILDFRGCPAVVDALLYNRDELTAALQLQSECVLSDEELLLTLIDRKGFEALAMVNGDFAGAIFDATQKEWILFRDHLGVRPLFFYRDRDLFAFSTDLRALVAMPALDARVNGMLLYQIMTMTGGMNIRDTEFAHIHCILPGTFCRFRMTDGNMEMTEAPYWRINSKKIRFRTDEEYRAELRRLVTDSVHRRCDAIPGLLGAELSGGLDSSVIDIILNRHGRKAVYFSWSADPERYPLRENDERIVIRDICDQEQIECRYLHREDSFGFDYIQSHMMPPYINTPPLCYGSMWMRSQGARVVFSGHGGDEGVSHRAGWLELLYNGEFASYFKLCLDETRGMKLHFLRAIKVAFLVAWRKWKSFHWKPTYEILHPPVFTQTFNDRMSKECKFQPMNFSYLPVEYIKGGGTRPRLDNAAFLGAFSGTRYLFPYVDHRVIDFAVSIPRRLHVNHNTSRLLFRETFADLMPKSLRDVRYKDTPSTRNVDVTKQKNRAFHSNVEGLLSRLDPAIWEGILDFEGIRKWNSSNITNAEEQHKLMYMLNQMNSLILTQTILKEAKDWRNRHD